ncbi:MAG: OOP family OmpA-OmpF porin [Marivirga sp.]|jgi:OOP family OmpA-OmpF porin
MKAISLIPAVLLNLLILNNLRSQEIIKTNLLDSVNTSFAETKPMISPDGEVLYFARQNSPENIGGRYDEQDIYRSNYSFEGWSKAVNLGEPLNNERPNGVISIAQNGKSLIVLNAYSNTGKQEGIAISHLSDSGWTLPKPIEIRDFHNHSDFVDYFLSGNGQEMLIAVERDDSNGDQDLYVSKKNTDDSWSSPINLGGLVNSKKAEFSPFLAADNKTLFFASYGHDGYGEADIFYTKRLDSTWTNWSKPENLGEDVNTDGFEAYYTIPNNGTIGYYVSSQDGIGDGRDIFSITIPYRFRPDPVILLKGDLLHADDSEDTSEFRVNFLTDMASESEIFVEYSGANFDALLPTGGSYFFYTDKEGYISESHYIDLRNQKAYVEELANIHNVPMAKGSNFVSHNLQFNSQTAELVNYSYFELIRLFEIFQKNEGMVVEIIGHAFDYDEDNLNDSISLARIQFIKDFLVSQEMNSERFVLKAKGNSLKAEASYRKHLNSEYNRNNRIEFSILSMDTVFKESGFVADNSTASNSSLTPNNMMALGNGMASNNTRVSGNNLTSNDGNSLVRKVEKAKQKAAVAVNAEDKSITIYFDFDSYQVAANKESLEMIKQLLKVNSFAAIELLGYTCTIGQPDYNKQLALLRAEAMRTWIEMHLADESINNGSLNIKVTAVGEIGEDDGFKNDLNKKHNRKVVLVFKAQG